MSITHYKQQNYSNTLPQQPLTGSRGTMTPRIETELSGNYSDNNTTSSACTDAICIFYSVTNLIIFILGVAGNGLVIWIAGFKLKKSVLTTWYLSLAMSDFIFCAFLPFDVIYSVKEKWIFGNFMCSSWLFILSLNLYSSIFLLTIISVDRCVVTVFPVWAQNQRTVRKASVIVMLAWIISAAFSLPRAIFVKADGDNCAEVNSEGQTAQAINYFIFGFLIPLLIIVTCYIIIIQKMKSNQMMKSKKPFKIMTALIATFLICWVPFYTFSFMALNSDSIESICFIFVSANSCLNPFLYAFMGRDFKKQCHAVLSKVQNVFEEEESQCRVQGTVITTSGNSNLLTTV